MRHVLAALTVAILVSGCASPPATPTLGADGRPMPQVYRISARDTDRIQFRMLDSINTLRRSAGVGELGFDAALNAAAATHSRDMAVQNRPWHFGSDGSSPLERVRRAGYGGRMLGETISETYETELETLGAWMEDPTTRSVLMDAQATRLGFEWFQEENGKIWWTAITGT